MADDARRIETGPLSPLNTLNPYLQGAYEPVAKETTALNLEVIGEIPKDLYGCFYRNGPNPAQAPEGMHHWFDGDGMLHAIYFENGKVVQWGEPGDFSGSTAAAVKEYNPNKSIR